MRSVLCLGAMLLGSLAYGGSSRDLLEVRTIYMMPMGSALDQYLAAQITKDGRYVVVTDPQRADAIFTDRIGQHFERAMDEMYPPAGKKETSDPTGFGKPPERVGGFSRARGTVFLVDRSSRSVIWSTFIQAGASHPKEVEKRARHIAERLNRQLKDAAKTSAAPVRVPFAYPEPAAQPAVTRPAKETEETPAPPATDAKPVQPPQAPKP
jgi:hypothetical protein